MNKDMREERAFFAAANSKDGFVGFFEEIFFGEAIRRRYIIKGGPGTGKSSFMRRAALAAVSSGKTVEYFYCSSDTDSLDGIIIDGSVAIFDGTAPHCYDTVLPGACDEIINLGEFWDSSALERSVGILRELGHKKRMAYANAYGYLSAAGKVSLTLESVMMPAVRLDKLRAAVGRICERLGEKKGDGKVRTRQVSAFGTKGQIHLDTLRDLAVRIHSVDDYYGTAALFLSELVAHAKKEGYAMLVSFDTVDPSKVTEIYFPASGDYFAADVGTVGEMEDYRVNMKRFVDTVALSAIRPSYRAARQVYNTLCELALDQLRVAGEAHGEIEKYYVSSMDFVALQRFCDSFLKKI